MKQKYIVWMLLAALPLAMTASAEAQQKQRKNTGQIIQQPAAKGNAPVVKKAPAKEAPKEEVLDKPAAKPAAAPSNPYESSVWNEDDVKKMCAHRANGPRGYNNCIERNGRRIGRVKQPLDNNLIE